MKISGNIEMLELARDNGVLHPVLLWDDNDVVLIDTGLPMETEALREAVKSAGFELEDITKVILTHQDLDHVGSAKALSDRGAKILAHEIEAPYIEGAVTSIRITEMESRLSEMNEEERAFYEKAKKGAPYFYARVDEKLGDGDVLDICGGIQVVHTPGHMPGHIALLLKRDNILVVGDAAHFEGKILTGADPKFTSDMETAEKSFKKIEDLKPWFIITYHEGLYDNTQNYL